MSAAWRRGHYATAWELHALRVFGGFRIVWERWERTEDGWDTHHRDTDDPRVYPTEACAARAMEVMRRVDTRPTSGAN
jgi:hypothetical protein